MDAALRASEEHRKVVELHPAGGFSRARASEDGREPVGEFVNRELSWLAFSRRVLSFAEMPDLPLLERVKFAGIIGLLHDEFYMKRMGGLKRQLRRGPSKLSIDGLTPAEEIAACRAEITEQLRQVARLIEDDLRPALAAAGAPLSDHAELPEDVRAWLRVWFRDSVLPVLTPLAVDAEHPFPFISNHGLNLAVLLMDADGRRRFVRVKVPPNRQRWVPLPSGGGVVPLEQVIAANLDLLFPEAAGIHASAFRVTRGAEGDAQEAEAVRDYEEDQPGSIVDQVTSELKARRFAGVVRLTVSRDMPEDARDWLAGQLRVDGEDVHAAESFVGLGDLVQLAHEARSDLRTPQHEPSPHPRLAALDPADPSSIFAEIGRGDVLLHHPYVSFDDTVLRFLRSAAFDPQVLAIKITIYRTSADSPIVQALAEAARRGKQVAVLVEITARFDEAPNIAWGRLLEHEGVHVAYGVKKLKTHVKLALVVREERGALRRYVHVGTGNYHSGTARVYEDLGILTADATVCEDVTRLFNELTAAIPAGRSRRFVVGPRDLRPGLLQLIRREAEHARAGRPSGIRAKMNQLQDPEIIRELYAASRAGAPVSLNVRGLCCLRPGVPGLSDGIRVFGIVGRFLEHSRTYVFENGGEREIFIGSTDWMRRNLDRRIEVMFAVTSPSVQKELLDILDVYEADNTSAWDCGPDGTYTRRTPPPGAAAVAAQDVFVHRARAAVETRLL